FLHTTLRSTGAAAVWAFFSHAYEENLDVVPRTGATIIVANHHNQLVDVCVLTRNFPYRRVTQYWAKASLFRNPIARYVLTGSGNVPVDRRSSDNLKLFGSSLKALSKGGVLTLFPEGTSYTEPRIIQVKDGTSWLALEYSKWRLDHGGTPLVVIPVGIVYTDKQHYRSSVIKRWVFGPSIDISDLEAAFAQADPSAQKEIAKKLTARIEAKIIELTINAPDWDAAHAALIARQILWNGDAHIPLGDFVDVSQTLTDLFSSPELPPGLNIEKVKVELVQYLALLEAVGTSHDILTTMQPPESTTMPQRPFLRVLQSTASAIINFPPFALPFVLHIPTYLATAWAAALTPDEVEAVAQNKIVLGLLTQTITYPLFTILISRWSSLKGWNALILTLSVIFLHSRLIDSNYTRFKLLRTAWTLFWGTRTKDELTADQLAPFLIPWTPPPNPYVRMAVDSAPAPPRPPPRPTDISKAELVPHLLRARTRAITALGDLMNALECSGDAPVAASEHLARVYGFGGAAADKQLGADADTLHTKGGTAPTTIPTSSRKASEVFAFLKGHGAVFPCGGTS
ncbi:hypothetical protein BKA62DRAFT_780887, partial [Auriculariales sp. MPI-PUGE-AT-0066]